MRRAAIAFLAILVILPFTTPSCSAWSEKTHEKLLDLCIAKLPVDWRRFFIYYIEEVRDGVIAPTRVFKRAEYHYYHPETGEGLGPYAVQKWYSFMVKNLTDENWRVAAYCAGVILCYISDLANPLNTNASAKETLEIYNYYADVVERNFDSFQIELSEPVQVENATAYAIEVANRSLRYYEELVEHLVKYGWDTFIIAATTDCLQLAGNATVSLWMSAIDESGKSPPSYTTGWLFIYKYHEWIIVSVIVVASISIYELWRRKFARKSG